MAAIDDALAQIEQALELLAPRLEGFFDYRRLNIFPATQREVDFVIAETERRILRLTETRDALIALIGDGPWELPIRQVDQDHLDDLRRNKETIDLALARFAGREQATTLNMSAGVPTPKP